MNADQHEHDRLKGLLQSRRWRLNNLYHFEPAEGHDALFRMNDVQAEIDDSLHTRNVILKTRQRGITTWACIRALDTALFRPHTACGVIAHVADDAKKFFHNKIVYAYERLPDWLRNHRRIVKFDGDGEITLSNDSRIVVGVSLRSGTYQRLHVSELGKMDETDPKRAAEVVAGALNTVPTNGIVTVESTARVATGHFYGMCQRAMSYDRLVRAGTAKLTPLDYKFYFLPWFDDPAATLNDPSPLAPEMLEYFTRIEAEAGVKIPQHRRAWYAKKREEQQDQMYLEYPSTPEEAFWVSAEGAYYANLIALAEQQGRICNLPFIPGIPVNTFWDIGRNDTNAIWFHQEVGPWHHFIDYYENSGEGAAHYATELRKRVDERGYVYGTHYLPHDGGNTDWSEGQNRTREQVLNDLGVKPTVVVPRIEVLGDGIDMVRQALPRCRFDRVRCGETRPGSGRGGIPSLRNYRKAFNVQAQVYSTTPFHNWASNGADAFRQFAQGYETAVPRRVRKEQDPRREGGPPTARWKTA